MHRYHAAVTVTCFAIVMVATVGWPWAPMLWAEVDVDYETLGYKASPEYSTDGYGSELMQIQRTDANEWSVTKRQCNNLSDASQFYELVRQISQAPEYNEVLEARKEFVENCQFVKDPDEGKIERCTQLGTTVQTTLFNLDLTFTNVKCTGNDVVKCTLALCVCVKPDQTKLAPGAGEEFLSNIPFAFKVFTRKDVDYGGGGYVPNYEGAFPDEEEAALKKAISQNQLCAPFRTFANANAFKDEYDDELIIYPECQIKDAANAKQVCQSSRGLTAAVQVLSFLGLLMYAAAPEANATGVYERVRAGVLFVIVLLTLSLLIVHGTANASAIAAALIDKPLSEWYWLDDTQPDAKAVFDRAYFARTLYTSGHRRAAPYVLLTIAMVLYLFDIAIVMSAELRKRLKYRGDLSEAATPMLGM